MSNDRRDAIEFGIDSFGDLPRDGHGELMSYAQAIRAALRDADVFPRTDSGRRKTWVGVGGSPQSVIRTARYGFRLMLAIIGGSPDRFGPYIDLYRRATEQFGTTAYPVGTHSPGFIADTDAEARR